MYKTKLADGVSYTCDATTAHAGTSTVRKFEPDDEVPPSELTVNIHNRAYHNKEEEGVTPK
jgi:hypothetical protein